MICLRCVYKTRLQARFAAHVCGHMCKEHLLDTFRRRICGARLQDMFVTHVCFQTCLQDTFVRQVCAKRLQDMFAVEVCKTGLWEWDAFVKQVCEARLWDRFVRHAMKNVCLGNWWKSHWKFAFWSSGMSFSAQVPCGKYPACFRGSLMENVSGGGPPNVSHTDV